jgi:hypothetical protein
MPQVISVHSFRGGTGKSNTCKIYETYVNAQHCFFPSNVANSQHNSELAGKSPKAIHFQSPMWKLPAGSSVLRKLSITEKQVRFLRAEAGTRRKKCVCWIWTGPCAGLGRKRARLRRLEHRHVSRDI